MPIGLPPVLTRALRRPLVAGAVLLGIYVVLSFAMDPHGYLGTDTGAKVATLDVMSRSDTTDPDVGYWAEDLDPEGTLHPLYQATARADGGWVAVTTLPVLELARPLYDLGGYRAALLLPMLGAVGAAAAAKAVARRIGAVDDGWSAYWLVGLASPMAIYALDFWEHSIGVACMVGAVALLLDVSKGRLLPAAPAAGLLLGASSVLRNETFVYALVGVGVATTVLWVRTRSPGRPMLAGVLTVGGFTVPWFANVALEAAVGAPARAARATGTAAGFGSDLWLRTKEGAHTSIGLNSGPVATSALLGLVVVLVVLVAMRGEGRGDRRFAIVGLAAAGCVYAFDAAGGLGFVPGLLLAFPLAIAGVFARPADPRARLALAIALLALPIVYLVQYTGGAAPQWGGRYTLTSSILLGVVGLVTLGARRPTVARGLVALSVLVTCLGLAFLSVRARGVDEFFDDVVAEAEPVVISRNAFLIREGGAAVVGRRWLSVADEPSFRAAIAVAREVGERRFTVLEWGGEAPPATSLPPGVREVARSPLTFVDVPVGLVTYAFVDEAE
ncbi:MAG: hypothetical protein ACT452_00950 [Microthrixaceae bacterium]